MLERIALGGPSDNWLDEALTAPAPRATDLWLYNSMLKPVCDGLCDKLSLDRIPAHLLPRIEIEDPERALHTAAFAHIWTSANERNNLPVPDRAAIRMESGAPFDVFVEQVAQFVLFHYLTVRSSPENTDLRDQTVHPFQRFFLNPLWSEDRKEFAQPSAYDPFDDNWAYNNFIRTSGAFAILQAAGVACRHLYLGEAVEHTDRSPKADFQIGKTDMHLRVGTNTYDFEFNTPRRGAPSRFELDLPVGNLFHTLRTEGLTDTLRICDEALTHFVRRITPYVEAVTLEDGTPFVMTLAPRLSIFRTSPYRWIGSEVGAACARKLLSEPASIGAFQETAFTPYHDVDVWMRQILDLTQE